MTDQPVPNPEPHEDEPGVHSFEVDIGMYLPEGVELAEAGSDAGQELISDDPDEVDTRLLEQIEGELDEVDAALRAIDSNDERSSPLLRRLLAVDEAT